jgi:predicted MFS family arabinose efflux permease
VSFQGWRIVLVAVVAHALGALILSFLRIPETEPA